MKLTLLAPKKRGIIDRLPGVVASYGLSKMSQKYSGPCLRVYRASDGKELDIGFVGSRKKLRLSNALVNGNGWSSSTAAVSVVGSTVSIAGNGSASMVNASFETNLPCVKGHIIYTRALYKVTNANCSMITLSIGGSVSGLSYIGSGFIQNPVTNTSYDMTSTFRVEAITGLLKLDPLHIYPSALTASGKVLEIKDFVAFDLTSIFGAGNEPTREQLDPVVKSIISTKGYITEVDVMDVFSINTSGQAKHFSNAVENGNFALDSNSDGLADGWGIINAPDRLICSGNTQRLERDLAGWGILSSGFTGESTTDVHYMICEIKTNSPASTVGISIGNATRTYTTFNDGIFHYASSRGIRGTRAGYELLCNSSFVGYAEFKNVVAFNLTSVFGVGNEPTKAQLDSVIESLIRTQGYFTEKDVLDVWSPTVVGGNLPRPRVYNDITNGNFEFGTLGWSAYSSKISASAGVLTITADGTNLFGIADQLQASAGVAGRRIFVKSSARVINSGCTVLKMDARQDNWYGTSQYNSAIFNPVQNTWYPLSFLVTIPASVRLDLIFRHDYADASSANGKKMEVKNVILVDMGADSSNPLYSKTQAEMEKLVGDYVNAFGFETGEIDFRSLLQFLGTSNGSISKWYAQDRGYKQLLNTEAPYNPETWSEWTKDTGIVADSTGMEYTARGTTYVNAVLYTALKDNTKYGVLVDVLSNSLTTSFAMVRGIDYGAAATLSIAGGYVGAYKNTLTTGIIQTNKVASYINTAAIAGLKIKIRDFRIYELPAGSQIEADFNTLTADQMNIKYPFGNSFETVVTNHAVQTTLDNQPRVASGGVLDNGLFFDGVNDHLVIPNVPRLGIVKEPLSLFANLTVANFLVSTRYVLAKNLDSSDNISYGMDIVSTQRSRWILGGMPRSSTVQLGIAAGLPTKITHLWQGGTTKSYLNTVLSADSPSYSGVLTDSPYLTIGARQNGATVYGSFIGTIRSLIISNRAFMDTHIKRLKEGVT